MRIGNGYDLHRLSAGRRLILGGVEIPFEKGLYGHSDADVLTHAIMDALLGAASLGDLGKHFPDTDDTYKNADSLQLLRRVVRLIGDCGYEIENIDSTVVAQQPKLAPYIAQMRERIAEACEIETYDVSIKATTEEGLGATGTCEAISAHAVVLLK